MKAIKPVVTGPEQSMSEPAQGGGLKSPALACWKPDVIPRREKILRLKTIKFNQAEKGGIKPKAGVQTGVQTGF